ncbi:sensor histidine kinase [Plantactinospora sp. KBS50]|uniref:sensor histidine kinase n=1 Tax=Plantactinospora sp. KBS50 TaxID=2024580 RepID=UPI000BAAF1EE|nr:sensor histidine kinase [Plantactinospora sp. KBS50]ASW55900.1 hypothetical protein CIK06_19550 [Plantactinospora sp. KBS50]
MRSRSSNLRTKVVALLLSLTALWVFAAWVTVRDGLNLLWVQTYDNQIAQPSEPLVKELQVERRLSVTYLAQPGEQQRAALNASRERSIELAARFRESAEGWRANMAAGKELQGRIRDLSGKLDALAKTRDAIDAGSISRSETAQAFTGVLDAAFRVYSALGALDDPQIASDARNLIRLNRVREMASQEDALLAGALAAGKMTTTEHTLFVKMVGAQRFLADETVRELPDSDRAAFDEMADAPGFSKFRDLEDRVVAADPARTLPVSALDWRNTAEAALADLDQVVVEGGDSVVERATPVAAWVIIRMILAAGLGLIAVIASIVVSITTARALVQQLERLREAAWKLANERLPSLVERLGRGDKVDVAVEAPPLEFGTDEIGQVGQAFNAVQETAIRTAVEQAELRRNVREIFLSLARRTQALVHRQLTLLDAMERRETDAEELEDLFRVDHLATRMRRNAENLIVLSGSTPGRAWRRNVPMVDVVRGAVAEVEDYTRVTVLPFGSVALAGRAVGDVIHLLAELIENALSFSPPHTTVEVRGQSVANGYVIEIEDRGLGMGEDELAMANSRIQDRSEFNLATASRLGLFVVSRLTDRHGVRVQLKESPYGGTTAVVLVPQNLVSDDPDGVDETGGGGPAPAAALPGADGTGADAAPVATGGSVAVVERDRPSGLRDEPLLPAPSRASGDEIEPTGSGEPEALGDRPRNSPYQDAVARALSEPTTELPVRPGSGGASTGALPGPVGEPLNGTDEQGLPTRRRRVPGAHLREVMRRRPAPDAGAPPATRPGPAAPGTARPGGPPAPATDTNRSATPAAPAGRGPAADLTSGVGHDTESGQPTSADPTGPDRRPAAGPESAAEAQRTSAGLPVRVRQANLAAPLKSESDPVDGPEQDDQPARPPEQVRRMMSSYQSGTLRGRSAAAQLGDAGTAAADGAGGSGAQPAPGPESGTAPATAPAAAATTGVAPDPAATPQVRTVPGAPADGTTPPGTAGPDGTARPPDRASPADPVSPADDSPAADDDGVSSR